MFPFFCDVTAIPFLIPIANKNKVFDLLPLKVFWLLTFNVQYSISFNFFFLKFIETFPNIEKLTIIQKALNKRSTLVQTANATLIIGVINYKTGINEDEHWARVKILRGWNYVKYFKNGQYEWSKATLRIPSFNFFISSFGIFVFVQGASLGGPLEDLKDTKVKHRI